MEVSVTIASGSSASMLRECVESLIATREELNIEIIIVDNCASFDVQATLEGCPVTVLTNESMKGLAANQNQAISRAKGEFIFWLNDDTIVQPGCLPAMLRVMKTQAGVGAIAPALWNEPSMSTRQANIARSFPTPWRCFFQDLLEETPLISSPKVRYWCMQNFSPLTKSGPVPALGGAAILFRKAALDQIGPMDESYGMYYEETDWCYRLRHKGWQLYGVVEAQVVHLGGQTTRARADFYSKMQRESRLKFLRKFYPGLTNLLMERALPKFRYCLRQLRRLRRA